MERELAEKINEAIKEYKSVYGCSLGDVVLVLDYLHGYYLTQGLKEIDTGEVK